MKLVLYPSLLPQIHHPHWLSLTHQIVKVTLIRYTGEGLLLFLLTEITQPLPMALINEEKSVHWFTHFAAYFLAIIVFYSIHLYFSTHYTTFNKSYLESGGHQDQVEYCYHFKPCFIAVSSEKKNIEPEVQRFNQQSKTLLFRSSSQYILNMQPLRLFRKTKNDYVLMEDVEIMKWTFCEYLGNAWWLRKNVLYRQRVFCLFVFCVKHVFCFFFQNYIVSGLQQWFISVWNIARNYVIIIILYYHFNDLTQI